VREVVICSPVRTPVGRYGGVFKDVPAQRLAALVVAEVVRRTGAERIDDVIFGQCNPSGEAPAIGRVAALDAGLPVETPGSQIDRRCGSGLQAIINAVLEVRSGACDTVVGATGARIFATLLYELKRREARYGLETMCIGGGQGLAAVFERIG